MNEIFRKIDNLNNKLRIEDFNINSFEKFFDFFNLESYDKDFELPEISITFYLNYSDDSNLAVLSDFIIDLDDKIDYVKILVKYSIKNSQKEKFYESGKKLVEKENELIVFLKKE